MSTALSALVPLVGPEPLLLLPTAVIRLQATGNVEPRHVPSLAGLVVAAAEGLSPLRWRGELAGDGQVSISASEWRGWVQLSVIVVELLDGLHGAGTCLTLLDDVARRFDC
jgi:hypothetical protein